MNMATDTDFDSILDTNLDDIEDLPEYLDFCPTGGFLLNIKECVKDKVEMEGEDKKKIMADVLRVVYEVQEVQELAEPSPENEALVKSAATDGKGSFFSESFFFHKDPKKSAEVFKAKYKEIAKKFSLPTIGALIEAMNGGVQIQATVKSKKGKGNNSDRFFINTSNIQVV